MLVVVCVCVTEGIEDGGVKAHEQAKSLFSGYGLVFRCWRRARITYIE